MFNQLFYFKFKIQVKTVYELAFGPLLRPNVWTTLTKRRLY